LAALRIQKPLSQICGGARRILRLQTALTFKRGYFNPVEDERLRAAYARYLAIRVSLWDIIKGHQPAARRVKSSPETAVANDLRDFAISFCAADGGN